VRRAVVAGLSVLVIGCLVVGGAAVDAASGQVGKAVVTGAERVVVRRGPGREFPPFASVSRGESVDVQEIKGEWARISTRRGEAGYVNSTFLALPGEHDRRAAPVGATATRTSAIPTVAAPTVVAPMAAAPTVAAPTVAAAPVAARPTVVPVVADAGAGRTAALEADVRRLREELAAATSRTPVPVVAPAVPVVTVRDIEPLREQLQQTLAALDALQRRVEATGASADSTADDSSSLLSSHSLFVLIVGLLAGWVAHTVYGRTSDRGHRSRIRF
jgi:SH3-like domain-containing protein